MEERAPRVAPTVQALYGLLRAEAITPITIFLYTYFKIHHGKPCSYKQIHADTGVNTRFISAHINALVGLGILEKQKWAKGPGTRSTTYFTKPFPSKLRINLLALLSSLDTLDTSKRLQSLIDKSRQCLGLERAVSYDYTNDAEWKSIKKSLLKHFKSSEVNGDRRLTPKMYMKLLELYGDAEVNMDHYARWYKDEKYSRLAFQWRMLLLPSMVDEYKAVAEDVEHNDIYLRTSSKEQKDKFAKAAAEKRKWIRQTMGGSK